jgi:hypothetical protein
MSPEKERKLFTEYPYHIAMLVKAAQKAIKEGLIRIETGQLVVNSEKSAVDPPETSGPGNK